MHVTLLTPAFWCYAMTEAENVTFSRIST